MKPAVPGLWTVLMHLIIRGILGKQPPGTNPCVTSHIPFLSTQAHSGSRASDCRLSEVGVALLTSRASPGLIPGPGEGRPGCADTKWNDFVNRAHMRHPELTQVESTLISMRKWSI